MSTPACPLGSNAESSGGRMLPGPGGHLYSTHLFPSASQTWHPNRARGSSARGRDTGSRLSWTCGCLPGISSRPPSCRGTDWKTKALLRHADPPFRLQGLHARLRIYAFPVGSGLAPMVEAQGGHTADETAPLEQLSKGLQNKIIATNPGFGAPRQNPYSMLSGSSGQRTAPGPCISGASRMPFTATEIPRLSLRRPAGFTRGGQSYCLGTLQEEFLLAMRSLTL